MVCDVMPKVSDDRFVDSYCSAIQLQLIQSCVETLIYKESYIIIRPESNLRDIENDNIRWTSV